MRTKAVIITLLVLACLWFDAQSAQVRSADFVLDSVRGLELFGTKAEVVNYQGRRAVHFLPLNDQPNHDGSALAILNGTSFKDGTIELDVAGFPGKRADATNRGFIGLAFRVRDKDHAEYFYLRPTNGRADDQVRRNHSVQYESRPDYPWHRLRQENSGVYESYADLQSGVWTHMKVVVSGTKAKLYVNGAAQPCLVVNDLKLGDSEGQIALWAHADTEGYFSNLRVY